METMEAEIELPPAIRQVMARNPLAEKGGKRCHAPIGGCIFWESSTIGTGILGCAALKRPLRKWRSTRSSSAAPEDSQAPHNARHHSTAIIRAGG